MGELLLCTEPAALMPFYIEGISCNIFSMEELCYYILKNTYLLDRDFMSEELCSWIEKNIKRVELANRLRQMLHSNGKLSEFVDVLLKDCGYCTAQEIHAIYGILCEMEEKSDFECNKIRADRLMERGKYLSAMNEYKRLLELEDALQEEPELLGKIWHNLGVSYARMFLFEEAIRCFEKAYQLGQNQESLREQLFAYRCMHDEQGFLRTALEHGLDDTKMQEIRNELTLASRDEGTVAFEERLEEIANLPDAGLHGKKQQAITELIYGWKEDYRRISRV